MSNFIIFPFSKVHVTTNQLCVSLWQRDFVDSPLAGYELVIYDTALEAVGSPKLVTRELFDVLQKAAAIRIAEQNGCDCSQIKFWFLRWKYGRDHWVNEIVNKAIEQR
ncbi:TPA: hypothetical protein NJ504_003513 [Vibrio parahaemolyticus]|nr:hypothetical protein [Vibrio parahaemolyticus]HCG8216581.1 hypothetical protein [Vibrio parahaemolyticus]HCM0851293.1 hypothetical protein [Vibrio parahaemolyticus]